MELNLIIRLNKPILTLHYLIVIRFYYPFESFKGYTCLLYLKQFVNGAIVLFEEPEQTAIESCGQEVNEGCLA